MKDVEKIIREHTLSTLFGGWGKWVGGWVVGGGASCLRFTAEAVEGMAHQCIYTLGRNELDPL